MADNRTPEQRRVTMQNVRSKNTTPEMTVRRLVHSIGYRYRLHCRDLPGKPDLTFRPRQRVIFVHGCFWHAHGCKIGKPPKSRPEFWLPKLARNRNRDRENEQRLQALGWDVLTIWQCEVKDICRLRHRIKVFLDPF